MNGTNSAGNTNNADGMNNAGNVNNAGNTNNTGSAGNMDSGYSFQSGSDAFAGYTAGSNYTTYTNSGATSPIIKEKHRGLGILGALGGALLGGLIWTGIGCLGFISGWIAILIFFLAQAGYKKLNGEQDILGVIVSLVFGLLVIIPATYASYGFSLWRSLNDEFGSGFSFFEVLVDMPMYMERYGLWSDFIKNLVMGYAFTGIAAIYVGAATLTGRKKTK